MPERLPRRAQLGERLDETLACAARIHRAQARKGTHVPCVGHLLGVASLVIDGGDENEAITALLHDAVEDHGGAPRLDDIRARFGDRVAAIVRGRSDSEATGPADKFDWRVRKTAYIEHLQHAPREVLRISCADKPHTARAIVADHRASGDTVFDRFKGGKRDTLCHDARMVNVFKTLGPRSSAAAFVRAVRELRRRLAWPASEEEPPAP